MGAVGQGLLDVGGLGGPETSNRLVGMACCQRPAATSPARLSVMVEAASGAIWQGHQGQGARLAAIGQQYERPGIGDGARAVGNTRLTDVEQIVLPARELACGVSTDRPAQAAATASCQRPPWPQARLVTPSSSSQAARSRARLLP